MIQINIFDYLYPPFKIKTPIRLIELFAGVGSQAMALRDIGADFEHYRVVEFDKFAIRSYNAIHGTNFKTMDIRDIHADDLGICEKQRFTYLLTYSFPCQDLSSAGKRKGMKKGSNTRSGLLWEVERILIELKEKDQLPQILLMENVPDVIGTKNIDDFNEWYASLEKMGYQSYYKVLNAKDYGIPQNRERCFMVSILGKYSYQFPKGIKLKNRLKDVLEDRVDEKYYLSQKIIETFTRRNEKENGFHFDTNERDIAKTVTAGVYKTRMDDNYVKVCGDVDIGNNDMNNRVYSQEGIAQTLTTSCNQGVLEPVGCQIRPKDRNYNKHGKQREDQVEIRSDNLSNALLTISQKNMIVEPQFRIRKLTPLECWRLMGFTDEDFKKAQQVNSNSQLYKQAGNSIVKQVLMAIFKEMMEVKKV